VVVENGPALARRGDPDQVLADEPAAAVAAHDVDLAGALDTLSTRPEGTLARLPAYVATGRHPSHPSRGIGAGTHSRRLAMVRVTPEPTLDADVVIGRVVRTAHRPNLVPAHRRAISRAEYTSGPRGAVPQAMSRTARRRERRGSSPDGARRPRGNPRQATLPRARQPYLVNSLG
jgi:hypothetical protein